jgi:phage terminase large subunit GpA-like protein
MVVKQVTVMKSSVAGFTEAALNGIRYAAKHDPQNVGFAIDNRVEAGTINEVRLQPTLRRLGENVFTDNSDDAGKFLLKLRRMLVYFLGSYSPGAFANKMFELAISDEREEHAKTAGDTSTTENLRSRVKSSPRGLLIEMSKPKMAGGPIDAEHAKGSMHVPEVPCPHCTAAAAASRPATRSSSRTT